MNLNENIPVNNTQYRESILVCKNKENFIKLCQAINSAKSKLDEFVNVYAIGKLKIKLSIKNDLPKTNNDGLSRHREHPLRNARRSKTGRRSRVRRYPSAYSLPRRKRNNPENFYL